MHEEDYDLMEKEKHSLISFLLSALLLVGFPLFWFGFFKKIFMVYETHGSDGLDYYTAMFLGFGIGFLFQMICVLKGILKESHFVYVMRKRMLKANLKISFKFALKIYFTDIKENGIGYAIYMVIILGTLFTTLFGLYNILFMVG
jgi:hypothetical protein